MFITMVLENSKFDQKPHFLTFLKTLTKQECDFSHQKQEKKRHGKAIHVCSKLHCFIHYNVQCVVYIVPYILCITLYVPNIYGLNSYLNWRLFKGHIPSPERYVSKTSLPPPTNAMYVDKHLSNVMWHPSCASVCKNKMPMSMGILFSETLTFFCFSHVILDGYHKKKRH